jgi:hypothetical protein
VSASRLQLDPTLCSSMARRFLEHLRLTRPPHRTGPPHLTIRTPRNEIPFYTMLNSSSRLEFGSWQCHEGRSHPQGGPPTFIMRMHPIVPSCGKHESHARYTHIRRKISLSFENARTSTVSRGSSHAYGEGKQAIPGISFTSEA